MVVLSPFTKKHTRVSSNRVIIVASGQISRDILFLIVKITIDAKKEMQQKKQRNYPERAVAAVVVVAAVAAVAAVAVVAAAAAAAAAAVQQHAQMQQ